jgi:hypothetical protein
VDEEIGIRVYDPQGRSLHQQELLINSKRQTWDFSLGVPGTYTFVFIYQDQAYTKKLTVTKRF